MMKVFICNKLEETNNQYFRRGWRTPYGELENIGWTSIDVSEINGKLSDFLLLKYNKLPEIIFFWDVDIVIIRNMGNILQHKWKKYIYIDDLHRCLNIKNFILPRFDYIFCTCAYTFNKFYPIIEPEKIIWYPHNINNKFFIEFNKHPQNKILLSGSTHPRVYPFRYFVYKLSKTNKYPINILEQLSYVYPSHQYYGHEYIKYLNQYICCITCCSNSETPYVVNKFFEIPASGSLLLAYDEYIKEPLKELGFIDGENYISATYDNITEKIAFITNPDNRILIDRIRLNGYNLVWNNHKLSDRIKIIENITNKDLNM